MTDLVAPPAAPPGTRSATATGLVHPRIVAATARRVLTQLRGDHRTVAMLLVVPSVLLALISQMFDSQPDFNRIALTLIGIFPFTLMFLITSIAMLRERTGGTLERLLTTPLSKLDLLLGYGVAFAVAATAQASVTCLTAYLLLGLYTPGSPLLVLGVAIAGAVLGMAIGLLASAFATSEFQAVQFMPIVVMPQVFLGGLFVPREQMSDVLEAVSEALPLTYSIESLSEVGATSVVTSTFLFDAGVVVGAAVLALVLAATTLRRRTGDPTPAQRRRRRLVPLAILALAGGLALNHTVDTARWVTVDDAVVDGDQVAIVAPTAGTLVDWRVTLGSTVRADQAIGRLQTHGGAVNPRMVLRAPAGGTVVQNTGVDGTYVDAGTRLAVVYDLAEVYVTARVDEGDLPAVRIGGPVEVVVDADPSRTLTGHVRDVQGGTAATFAPAPPDNTTGTFDRATQVVAVRIAIADPQGLALVPGMSATVRISRS
ncbi:MAG: ABC transporter permease [Pseudonocardia sp.]